MTKKETRQLEQVRYLVKERLIAKIWRENGILVQNNELRIFWDGDDAWGIWKTENSIDYFVYENQEWTWKEALANLF